MRTDGQWLDLISRERFDLSEECPIRALMACHESAGQAPLFDMHYEFELGIVLSGQMRRHSEDGVSDYGPGDVWAVRIWELHGFNVLEAPCNCIVLVIWPPLVRSLVFPEAPHLSFSGPFTGNHGEAAPSTEAERERVLELAERLRHVASDDSPDRQLRLRLLLVELLALLPQTRSADRPRPVQSEFLYETIAPALELVFVTRKGVNVPRAAAACSMSPSHFSRTFRSLMNITYAQFALRHRVRGAAQDLSTTELPVRAIAARWGFVDESHMHRLFLKYFGCGPSAYRGSVPEARIVQQPTTNVQDGELAD